LGDDAPLRLGVAAQLFPHESVGEVGVRREVDALPPHALAHPVGDEGDGCAHPAIVRIRAPPERMFSTAPDLERLHLVDPPLEESTLGVGGRELEGSPVLRQGFGEATAAAQQVGTAGRQKVVPG
jgi:hypothetical protein